MTATNCAANATQCPGEEALEAGPPALGTLPEELNVGAYLAALAARAPESAAVIAPAPSRLSRRVRWISTSAAELDRRCDAIAHGLAERGLARGDRAAIFVRPGADWVAITFALFKLGAVPVLIDPGIGVPMLLHCLAKMQPRAFLGVPTAQILRALHARELSSIAIRITVGPGWFPGATSLDQLARGARGPFAPARTRADETAAILFTSGATGPAKGVVYTHGMFEAQIRALHALYRFESGEIDLACFPLFALFDVALGMTSVFPPLDPSHPARCDPEAVVAAILEHRATTTFGSPAIWRRVMPWCAARGQKLPSLARVIIAGAPVPTSLVDGLARLLDPAGSVYTPYGATEALPLTSISNREILGALAAHAASGAGTCVGRPAPGIELALIEIDAAPVADAAHMRRVPPGTLGEICARGPVVAREYALDPEETLLAKIPDGESVWHRTGDVGWIDGEGRLWFCGRKAQRIEMREGLVMPVPSENVYNLHPHVRRSALVGVGARGEQRPILIVEPEAGSRHPKTDDERRTFAGELVALMRSQASRAFPPRLAEPASVLFHPSFPVDVRHNAKIRREELARWAEEQGA